MKKKILKKFLLHSLFMSTAFIITSIGAVWLYTSDFDSSNTRVIKFMFPIFYITGLVYYIPLVLRALRVLLDIVLNKLIKNTFTIIYKESSINYDKYEKNVYSIITATDSKGKRKKFLVDESMPVLNYYKNNKVIIEYFKFSGVVTSIERAPK